MASTSYSVNLCNHIISSQQDDLFVIFENFSDKVSDPENNTFFIQNEILDKILTNIENCKRRFISLNGLFKGITSQEKILISDLEIETKLEHDSHHCKILGVDYFKEDLFMSILNEQLKLILSKYNLNANDDYNKLYKFLSSIKLTLQSSDDVLSSLSNQYVFFGQHTKSDKNKSDEEVIIIYGKKHYKIDILKHLLDEYNAKINVEITNKSSKGTR